MSRRTITGVFAVTAVALMAASGCGVSVSRPKAIGPTAYAVAERSCHDLTLAQMNKSVDDAKPVPCTAKHTSLTMSVTTVTAARMRSREAMGPVTEKVCGDAFAATLGGTREQRDGTIFRWVDFYPSPQQRSVGARWLRCDLIAVEGTARDLPSGNGPFLENTDLPDQYRYCLRLDSDDTPLVSCDQPHDATYRTSAVATETSASFPGDDVLKREAHQACRTTGRFYYVWPHQEAWTDGDRSILCFR